MLFICILYTLFFISDREIWRSLQAVESNNLFTRQLVGQKEIKVKPHSFDSSVSVYRISVNHKHTMHLGEHPVTSKSISCLKYLHCKVNSFFLGFGMFSYLF